MSEAIGTLGTIMRNTRTTMVATKVDATAIEFYKRFNMRDGDYIEFDRAGRISKKEMITLGRIVMVEDCYYNQRGGYTANVKVAPLLVGGRIGNTRSVMMAINANGTGLNGVGRHLRRVSSPKEST